MATNRKKKSGPAPKSNDTKKVVRKLASAVTGDDRITVVGIGASAGGLKALQAFFESLPSQTGLAYVVVTHLHPEHESHLADLLQGRTPMGVSQVLSPTLIEPDHVYCIPPNRNILVTDSHLDVAEFDDPRGQRTPVDNFFRSLARQHQNPAAIILSGSGTDGAVGIKDVKEAGGLLLVQDPYEAEYDGMPNAAIATGIVDAVLPVRDLARKLLGFVQSKPQVPPSADDLNEQERENLKRILAHVHARTGHDFSQYIQRVKIDNTEAILAAFSDITERKRVEQRVRDLLEAMPDAMLVIDEEGRVVLVNAQSEQTFGLSRGELVGQRVQKLFSDRYDGEHPVRRPEFFQEQSRASGAGGSPMRIFALRADGKEFPAEVSFSPLRTGDRDLVIAAVRDNSERVKAEQQIRGLALNLTTAEQQERHRISQVLHDDLQQRLFAIKTHLTFLEGGLREGRPQQLQSDFVDVARQLDEAISVTRNLSADMSPVVLQGEGLPDALLWLSQQMQERYGLNVELRNGDTRFVLEKSLRVILFQAVREVLFNVVKHAGTSHATVAFEKRDGVVRITVTDEGKGFEVARMPTGSTLLGLKRRLGLLGCQMEVVSELGKGTAVNIDCQIPDGDLK